MDESIKIGGVEAKQNNSDSISVVELGSTLEIEIQAEGTPGVAFQWFKLPGGKIRSKNCLVKFFDFI